MAKGKKGAKTNNNVNQAQVQAEQSQPTQQQSNKNEEMAKIMNALQTMDL